MTKFTALLALLLLQQPTPSELIDQARQLLQQAKDIIETPPPPPPPPPSPMVNVPAGGNLQLAIDTAPANATVALEAGAVYVGTFTLRPNLTLTTAGFVPPFVVGTSQLAAIEGTVFVEGVNVLRGLEIRGNVNDLVVLRPTADATIEHCHIHGMGSTKRGILLFGQAIIRQNLIDDIYRFGQESAGIGGWEGGPYLIEDNVIAAGSINVLIGGADPRREDLLPHDVTIRRNHIYKKPEWRALRSPTGQTIAAKNLLEFKIGRNISITDNLFEYSWTDGQTGFGLALSVRNQSGTAPYATVANVEIARNLVRHVVTGLSLMGQDDRGASFPSVRMAHISIHDNRFEDINPPVWSKPGTAGRAMSVSYGSENLAIVDNVFEGVGLNAFLIMHGPLDKPHVGFRFEGIDTTEGQYGLVSAGAVPGRGAMVLNAYAPGATWGRVTVRRGAIFTTQTYPAGTTIVTP